MRRAALHRSTLSPCSPSLPFLVPHNSFPLPARSRPPSFSFAASSTAKKSRATRKNSAASPVQPAEEPRQPMDDSKIERLLRRIPASEFRVAKTAQMLSEALSGDTAKPGAGKKSAVEPVVREGTDQEKWPRRLDAEPTKKLSRAEKKRLESEAVNSEDALEAYLKLHCESVADGMQLVKKARGNVAGPRAYAALVALCSAQLDYSTAEKAMETMLQKGQEAPASAFNALIFSPDMRHSWTDAMRWYRAMRDANVRPNVSTLHAISSAARKSTEATAQQAVAVVTQLKREFDITPTRVALEGLLHSAIRSRDVPVMVTVFDMAREAQAELGSELCASAVTSALYANRINDALKLLRLAPYITLNERRLIALISQLTRSHDWNEIEAQYTRSLPQDGPPTLRLLNQMLRAAAVCDRRASFDHFLEQITSYGYTPDIDTHNARLLFASRSSPQGGKEAMDGVLREIADEGLQPNARTYSIMLQRAVADGDAELSLRLWQSMCAQSEFTTQRLSYATALCTALRYFGRALKLSELNDLIAHLRSLSSHALPVEVQTAVVDSLAIAGDSEAALKYFFESVSGLRQWEAEPLYLAAMRVYSRTGDISRAVSLFEERRLLSAPHPLSLRMFKALLTACMMGGRKDIARKYALEMQGAFDPAKLQQADVTALLKFATSSDEAPAAASKAAST